MRLLFVIVVFLFGYSLGVGKLPLDLNHDGHINSGDVRYATDKLLEKNKH